jgi:hypothetical protein
MANHMDAPPRELLLSLPWELIHDGESYLFRGARGVRVRRQLPVREARTPILTPAPIRVLLVSPRPEDDSAVYIDHRVSARPLIQALDPLGARVELRILAPPTFKALDAELQRAHDDGRPRRRGAGGVASAVGRGDGRVDAVHLFPSCSRSSTAGGIRRWRRIRGFITALPSS